MGFVGEVRILLWPTFQSTQIAQNNQNQQKVYGYISFIFGTKQRLCGENGIKIIALKLLTPLKVVFGTNHLSSITCFFKKPQIGCVP